MIAQTTPSMTGQRRLRPIAIRTHVQGLRLKRANADPTESLCHIRVDEFKDGVIRGLSSTWLEPAEPVLLFFPPHGCEPGIDRRANVIDCQPTPCGFQVALHVPTA